MKNVHVKPNHTLKVKQNRNWTVQASWNKTKSSCLSKGFHFLTPSSKFYAMRCHVVGLVKNTLIEGSCGWGLTCRCFNELWMWANDPMTKKQRRGSLQPTDTLCSECTLQTSAQWDMRFSCLNAHCALQDTL